MKYAFFTYDGNKYTELLFTRNLPLEDLIESFYDKLSKDCLINIKKDENDHQKIIIWSDFHFKKFVVWSSRNPKESFAFDEEKNKQYSQYAIKRFTEMPAIRISRKNYKKLEKQWQNIYEHTPKYLILREHEDGHVDMLEQNELSPEDIKNMNREDKIYQNYKKRLEAYQKAHPNRSYIWRSPEDNEFESDFALYDPSDEQGVD